MQNDNGTHINILVTGATGFLGSSIVRHLSSYGYNILATGRKFSSKNNKVVHENVKYQLGDLAKHSFVKSLFSKPIDIVVNCASLSSIWGSQDAYHIANVITQKNLIEESIRYKVSRFIYISTASVYFNHRDSMNIKETDPLPSTKVNHYARTKYMAECMIKNSGLEYVILRPRALVGKGDTVIMPRLIRAYDAGKLKIIGSGDSLFNLTSIDNMVEAVRLSMTTPNVNEDYNITNGEPIRLWDAINYTLRLINKDPVTSSVPYWLAYGAATVLEFIAKMKRNGREPELTKYSIALLTKSSTFDITKAKNMLGYEAKQSTDTALQEFAEWYLSTSDSSA